MKSITYKKNSLKGRFLCAFFGHKFKTIRFITDHFKEFECRVCHLQVTNEITEHKLTLAEEHREINQTLVRQYVKKNYQL